MSPGLSQVSVASVENTVNAMLLAARGAQVVRDYCVTQLSRISELAVNDQAQARLSVRFHLVDARAGIAGRATANLRLVCQRCLGAVQVLVDDEFQVVLIASETEMDQVPEAQDVVIADATRLELSWLLEEQLLLAMPLVPTHATADECAQSRVAMGREAGEAGKVVVDVADAPEIAAPETQRPFANLRDVLNQNQKGRSK